jgi:hypothetical protein
MVRPVERGRIEHKRHTGHSEHQHTLIQNQLTFRRNLEHLGFHVKHGNRGRRIQGLVLRD